MKRNTPRGFTLIELMIVVAIIGILASIAIPEYTRLTLRARTGERREMINGISRAMSEVALSLNTNPLLTGTWNPAGAPGPTKRYFNIAQAGWNQLALNVEGRVYYTYQFVSDPVGRDPSDGATAPTLIIQAYGDLDNDGEVSQKTITYVGYGQAYVNKQETPEEGAEDPDTF